MQAPWVSPTPAFAASSESSEALPEAIPSGLKAAGKASAVREEAKPKVRSLG